MGLESFVIPGVELFHINIQYQVGALLRSIVVVLAVSEKGVDPALVYVILDLLQRRPLLIVNSAPHTLKPIRMASMHLDLLPTPLPRYCALLTVADLLCRITISLYSISYLNILQLLPYPRLRQRFLAGHCPLLKPKLLLFIPGHSLFLLLHLTFILVRTVSCFVQQRMLYQDMEGGG